MCAGIANIFCKLFSFSSVTLETHQHQQAKESFSALSIFHIVFLITNTMKCVVPSLFDIYSICIFIQIKYFVLWILHSNYIIPILLKFVSKRHSMCLMVAVLFSVRNSDH